MAFCSQCGATMPDGAKFCASCGAPAGATAEGASAPDISPPAAAPNPRPYDGGSYGAAGQVPPVAGSGYGGQQAGAAWTPPGSGPASVPGSGPGSGSGSGEQHAPLKSSGPSGGMIAVIVAVVALVVVLLVVQPWKTPMLTGDKPAAGAGGDAGAAKGGDTVADGGTDRGSSGDGASDGSMRGDDAQGDGGPVAIARSPDLAPVADAPSAPMVNDGSALAVSAPTLHRAFVADEGMAQRMYGGRPLLVSGTVTSVQLNTGTPTVAFEGQNRFVSVLANFGPEARGAVAGLGRGMTLTARCSGVKEVAGVPFLLGCRF